MAPPLSNCSPTESSRSATELRISSSQPFATALNVYSAVFWSGQVLSVEPVFFCPTMTIFQ
jgi:hypothetical protein